MSDKHYVEAHDVNESMEFTEVIPGHEDRAHASQAVFDKAKEFLTDLYGGKRCIVCEYNGQKPRRHIESHHVFEWSHWNSVEMQRVEAILRALSPFLHGLYLVSKEEILAGKEIPTLWNHPDLVGKPFTSLDDPRNQLFLCADHHQQATKQEIEDGYDIVGLHHGPWPLWLLYFVMLQGLVPMRHIDHHEHDGLDRRV